MGRAMTHLVAGADGDGTFTDLANLSPPSGPVRLAKGPTTP